MFCNKCGNKLKDSAIFCHKCGNKVHVNKNIEEKNINKIEKDNPKDNKALLCVARFDKRLFNYIIDLICLFASGFAFGFILSLYDLGHIIENVSENILGLIVITAYYLFFELMWQKTPAKWITKTKVVMLDGSKPPFGNILGRTLSRVIPFEAFSFLSKYPVGWHDKLSKTIVIDSK